MEDCNHEGEGFAASVMSRAVTGITPCHTLITPCHALITPCHAVSHLDHNVSHPDQTVSRIVSDHTVSRAVVMLVPYACHTPSHIVKLV